MSLRIRKLVKPSFQLRLAFGFLLTSVLAAMVQTLALGWSLGELADSTRAPGVWEHVPEILKRNLISTLSVLVPLVMSAGVLISFRIAGPLYGIERYLRAVARGEANGRCKVRRKDELQELCRLVNEALDRVRDEANRPEERSAMPAVASELPRKRAS